MALGDTDLSEREERLGAIVFTCLRGIEEGRPPDRTELLARHPEFAAELAEFFEGRDQVDRLAAPLRQAVGPVLRPTQRSGVIASSDDDKATPPLLSRGPPRHFGDYDLLEEIGRGGMGVVYRARQRSLGRTVALKMIRPDPATTPAEVQRFRNEAEMAAGLDHPNIVPVHEVAECHGRLYFTMKLVEGGSLAERLGNYRDDPRAAARLMAEVARAVHHANQRGVLHRDLKPANVLLDSEGRPNITDFGLARRVQVDTGLTQSGAIVGTPGYMAPEQTTGERGAVTTAADVYGLGAVLYALLTGRPPFQGETVLDTLAQVRGREPEPPRAQNGRVDRDLETICLKCLRKEPQKRYASAQDLADDLERFLQGAPIAARPIGLWERGIKRARQRPALTALLVVIGLAVLALLVVSLWFNAQLQEALKQTQAEWDRAEEHEAAERRRTAVLRAEGQDLLLQGQAAVARGDWRGARFQLTRVLAKVDSEPSLADLGDRGRRLLAEANRNLAEQAAREQARIRYEAFLSRREEARFHRTLFTGLDLAGDVQATQAAAQGALALFGLRPEGGDLVLPAVFTESQKAEVRAGCYELLLVLAEVAAHRQQAQKPDDVREQVKRAVGLLDRAAKLGPPTRAYHMRRAHYLALLGDGPGADQQQHRAAARQPAGALDHFLIGEEHYKRGSPERALISFENALRAEPDHFWARYFLAMCCLHLQRPAEARAHLTACLGRRPTFLWAYLLRGFANSELNDFAAAEADYARVMELRPDPLALYGIHVNQGVLRIRQGRLREGVAELRQAIALKPDHYQAHADLAQAYQALG
jgi:serine/threonine protein kinase/tetratricopeptide (TPR) repeat protein